MRSLDYDARLPRECGLRGQGIDLLTVSTPLAFPQDASFSRRFADAESAFVLVSSFWFRVSSPLSSTR